MANGDELLTTAQVAGLLKVSKKTVLRWLKSGRIRGTSLGSRRAGWRIWRSDVQRFLDRQGETAPPGGLTRS